jgi:hypothetical protein
VHASQLRSAVRAFSLLRSRHHPTHQPIPPPSEGRSCTPLDKARPHGCGNASPLLLSISTATVSCLRTAVSERILALLPPDDFGREWSGRPHDQVLWRVQMRAGAVAARSSAMGRPGSLAAGPGCRRRRHHPAKEFGPRARHQVRLEVAFREATWPMGGASCRFWNVPSRAGCPPPAGRAP